MVFEMSRDWECVSASKFAKIAAVSPVYLALVEQVILLIGQHTVGRRMRLGSRALRSSWMS